MRKSILFLFTIGLFSCKENTDKKFSRVVEDFTTERQSISAMLDSFNVAATTSDFQDYFNFFGDSATFIGTDAEENWTKKTFLIWAKPYFDKKTTWNFKALKRNIHFGPCADIAWFDELLNTQMKLCRGSGVVVKTRGRWRIQQYVLSLTIPNPTINAVVKLKSSLEDAMIKTLEK